MSAHLIELLLLDRGLELVLVLECLPLHLLLSHDALLVCLSALLSHGLLRLELLPVALKLKLHLVLSLALFRLLLELDRLSLLLLLDLRLLNLKFSSQRASEQTRWDTLTVCFLAVLSASSPLSSR